MIGKITIGKSFRGCIAYCLNDKIEKQNKDVLKDRAEVLMYNKCFGNERELVIQFNDVRNLNLKLSKPVLHVTLSLSPGEDLSRDKLMEMCEYCAKDLGFDNNQYIAITHRDTNHQHIHIVVNRIGFDKRTVSDSNNYQKIANYCRRMELKYELKQVLNPRRYLSKEQRNVPRFDKRKELLRINIQQALKECYSLQQFEIEMNKRGYKIIKGRGISFADEKKVIVKGSEVNQSLQTIEKILAQQQGVKFNKLSTGPFLSGEQANSTPGDLSHRNESNDLAKAIEIVLTPKQLNEGIDKDFLQKRKKKKYRSPRL